MYAHTKMTRSTQDVHVDILRNIIFLIVMITIEPFGGFIMN